MTNAQLYKARITGAVLSLVFGVLGFVFDSRVLFMLALVGSVVWLASVFTLANRVVDGAHSTKGRRNR